MSQTKGVWVKIAKSSPIMDYLEKSQRIAKSTRAMKWLMSNIPSAKKLVVIKIRVMALRKASPLFVQFISLIPCGMWYHQNAPLMGALSNHVTTLTEKVSSSAKATRIQK
jgi:hypothetical protein